MSKRPILVTNDDGITSPGIHALAEALEPLGEVWVCAPDREQSAVSHGVSLQRPLRVNHIRDRWFAIDGTPTDCVMLGVHGLMKRPPALVVSGINNGANLGDDLAYSGTVAGAHEGMLLGIPAIAVSNVSFFPEHLETAGHYARMIAEYCLEHGLPRETMLNVNEPDLALAEIRGMSLARMGRGAYRAEIIEREDPRGVAYYWIGGTKPEDVATSGSDFEAVADSRVSVTPLRRDLTCDIALADLAASFPAPRDTGPAVS